MAPAPVLEVGSAARDGWETWAASIQRDGN